MIIIKQVPDLGPAEVLQALAALGVPDDKITTGHGGVVVDERTALEFLTRYVQAVQSTAVQDQQPEPDTTTQPTTSDGGPDTNDMDVDQPRDQPTTTTTVATRPSARRRRGGSDGRHV